VASARVLGILSRQDIDADAFFAGFPVLCTTPEITLEVTDENKFDIVAWLQKKAELGEGQRCVIDGIRMDYENGWGLCRASNTSPKLVTRYEATDEVALAEIRQRFEVAISRAIEAAG
jgi:phosphomannomutase/phosphoglucomutase